VNVLGDQRHLLDHLLFEERISGRNLELLVELPELVVGLFPLGLVRRGVQLGIAIVDLLDPAGGRP
jgi:hypothetical protein